MSSPRRIALVIIFVLLLGVGGFLFVSNRLKPPPPAVKEIKREIREVIGTSVEGRAIESYTYGNGEKHLLFVGGVHGGYEWNSVLLSYKFMDYLKANSLVLPPNIKVTIIPSLNPDGIYKVLGREGRFGLDDIVNISKITSEYMPKEFMKPKNISQVASLKSVENNNVKKALEGIVALDIKGVNVTSPYKQKVIKYLDKIDPIAKKIGAVNTIVNEKGKLIGYNTDWLGLIYSLEKHTCLFKKKIVILGAGGSARGIVYGLKKKGAMIIILNRTISRARKLAKEFNVNYGGLERLNNLSGDILINSTRVGMYPCLNVSIATKKQFQNFSLVFDLVYNPIETKFLKLAKEAGCKTIDGLNMLVYQALVAFELWTGKRPNFNLMYKKAKERL